MEKYKSPYTPTAVDVENIIDKPENLKIVLYKPKIQNVGKAIRIERNPDYKGKFLRIINWSSLK